MLALSDHRESPLKRQNSRDRIRRLREIQALIPSGFLSRELLTQLAALSHNTRIIRGSSDTCGHNQTEKMLIATKKMRCQQHSYEALPVVELNYCDVRQKWVGRLKKLWTWLFPGWLLNQSERKQMSTSLLYHAFGVRGYRYQRTEHDGGMTLFHVAPSDNTVLETGLT